LQPTRERRGVYYTPEPVVQYIVKSVDYLLKTRFGLEGGLAHTADIVEYDREEAFMDENGKPDRSKLLKTVQEARPKVLILDPACGTGTFLYAVMDFIRAEFMKRGNAGLWSACPRSSRSPGGMTSREMSAWGFTLRTLWKRHRVNGRNFLGHTES